MPNLQSYLREVHQVIHCSVRTGQLLGIGGIDDEQHVEAASRGGGGGGHGGGLGVRLGMHGQQARCPQAGLPRWRRNGSSPNTGPIGEWAAKQGRPASQFEASQNLDSPACNVWVPANDTPLRNAACKHCMASLTWSRPHAAYGHLPMIPCSDTKLASTVQLLTWSRPRAMYGPLQIKPCSAKHPVQDNSLTAN